MTERPLLLLDVDGPLNPFRSPLAGLRGYTSHRMRPALWMSRRDPESRSARRGLRVRLHPSHGPRLLALPFELAWATTWMHQANTMIAPHIGLPADLPVIEWPELFARDPDGLSWKTRPSSCASTPATACAHATSPPCPGGRRGSPPDGRRSRSVSGRAW